MSFSFGDSNINQFKAQGAYKDGGGMGGGGMYMKQKKKRKEDIDEDILVFSENEKNEHEFSYDVEIKEEDIPKDTLFNKFVNWFRIKE